LLVYGAYRIEESITGAGGHGVSPKEALAFVERHGVVLEAARGPVPTLAETIAGGRIRGSWWAHPKGHEIFDATQAVGNSDDVLVCKAIDGKVTYVHRRLWPALVRLAPRFRKGPLARIWNEHTPSGAHRMRRSEFPEWVPAEVLAEASALSEAQAEAVLTVLLKYGAKATARLSPPPREARRPAPGSRAPTRRASTGRGTAKK
jgi:hypothetical protein